jgi:hypothetical protein
MSRFIAFLYTKNYDDSKVPEFCLTTADSHDQDMLPSSENPPSGLLESMSVNALVYKCADMLGIENLKVLACARFVRQPESAYAMDGFDDPLNVMFENTHPNDVELRLAVTRICLSNYAQIRDQSKTVQILKHHKPNVWNVFAQMQRSANRIEILKPNASLEALANYLSQHTRITCDRGCEMSASFTFDGNIGDPESICFRCDCNHRRRYEPKFEISWNRS